MAFISLGLNTNAVLALHTHTILSDTFGRFCCLRLHKTIVRDFPVIVHDTKKTGELDPQENHIRKG